MDSEPHAPFPALGRYWCCKLWGSPHCKQPLEFLVQFLQLLTSIMSPLPPSSPSLQQQLLRGRGKVPQRFLVALEGSGGTKSSRDSELSNYGWTGFGDTDFRHCPLSPGTNGSRALLHVSRSLLGRVVSLPAGEGKKPKAPP